MAARDPQFIVYLIALCGVLALIATAVLRLRRRARDPEPISQRPIPPVVVGPSDDAPLCKCGATATRPAPDVIPRVSWVDSIRRWVGLPPRYVLAIPFDRAPVYCDVHGRVADVLTEEELAVAVVVERKAAESRVVRRVAAFITSQKSGLDAKVFDAMTDDQKKDHDRRTRPMRPADVVPINRAANGDG